MFEVKKSKIESGYYFSFDNGSHELEIFFAGNLDLYWNIRNKYFVPVLDDTLTKTFIITKENYYIYSLFEKLYHDIKNYDYKSEGYTEQYKSLFHNNIIKWHSDEITYDDASFVTLKKEEESFVITFHKSKEVDLSYKTYAIRFSNNGSRYSPLNIIFMRMYQELIKYDPNYHQVHIEEYIYQKKFKL